MQQLTNEQIAQGVKSRVVCFATVAEAMAYVGVRVPPGMRGSSFSVAAAPMVAAIPPSFVAVHYAGVNPGTGDVGLMVPGNNCAGGGVNLEGNPDGWDNLIKATVSRCSGTKHFDPPNYGGPAEAIEVTGWGTHNLTKTAGKVSSIKYTGNYNPNI